MRDKRIDSAMEEMKNPIMNARSQLIETFLMAYIAETGLGLDAIEEINENTATGMRSYFRPKVTA